MHRIISAPGYYQKLTTAAENDGPKPTFSSVPRFGGKFRGIITPESVGAAHLEMSSEEIQQFQHDQEEHDEEARENKLIHKYQKQRENELKKNQNIMKLSHHERFLQVHSNNPNNADNPDDNPDNNPDDNPAGEYRCIRRRRMYTRRLWKDIRRPR